MTIAAVIWGTPLFVFPLAVVIALQSKLGQGFVEVTRDLGRIGSNLRSPIVSSFAELVRVEGNNASARNKRTYFKYLQVHGITTVRAFGAERFFINEVYERLEHAQAAGYYSEFPKFSLSLCEMCSDANVMYKTRKLRLISKSNATLS